MICNTILGVYNHESSHRSALPGDTLTPLSDETWSDSDSCVCSFNLREPGFVDSIHTYNFDERLEVILHRPGWFLK
jgi:hypothetical protein